MATLTARETEIFALAFQSLKEPASFQVGHPIVIFCRTCLSLASGGLHKARRTSRSQE